MTRRSSAQSSWPGYVPAIHVFPGVGAVKTWIPGTRPGMTINSDAPAAEVKSARINVTMPADVLDQIDRYAEREGFTRSGFLAQAAKKAMAA
jgi:hypothetical protein